MLNPDLDIRLLNKRFQLSNRHMTIDNFLAVDAALELHRMLRETPDSGWKLHDQKERKYYEIEKKYHIERMLHNHAFCMALDKITGLDVNYLEFITAYKYSADCFLAKRNDEKDGRKVAFTLNLTPNWQRRWGGTFVDHSIKGRDRELTPVFNQLLLFDVTLGKAPYSVTPVTAEAPWNRLSIAGRLR